MTENTATANLNGENVEEDGQDDDLPFEYSSMLKLIFSLNQKSQFEVWTGILLARDKIILGWSGDWPE